MTREDVRNFAMLIEAAGYTGAMNLVMEDLLPVAEKHGISLLASARRYADSSEEQDTSWYQLAEALKGLDLKELAKLDIDRPLRKGDIDKLGLKGTRLI